MPHQIGSPSGYEIILNMIRAVPAFLLLVFSAAPAAGQVSDRDRFKLYTGCAPVKLVVEQLSQDAIDLGLTVESLQTLVRSRLRSARIYSEDQDKTMLYLNVSVTSLAFSITLGFHKALLDPLYSREIGLASSWIAGSTGTHGKDAGYIRQAVSESTDKFIDEYLRVNAESCGGPSAPDNSGQPDE